MSVLPPMLGLANIGLPRFVLDPLPQTPPMKALIGSIFLYNMPHMVRIYGVAKRTGKPIDNTNPRKQVEELMKNGDDSIIKPQAAHQNGLESFPPFAAGVLAVVATGADAVLAGKLATLHLLSRFGFNLLYMGTSGEGPATIRSLMWLVSLWTSCQLLNLAGIKHASK
eukprot:TRINITY_DN44128_c0_g1_i1.p1 TRINITY_DN44128_c0_g1~~TRINITY_DN44128_c0_g1_i1.p1  ORF type:complete len:168 (-),score=24.89 TRINITY_DN44128_c0_g1_i1:67-570(-)